MIGLGKMGTNMTELFERIGSRDKIGSSYRLVAATSNQFAGHDLKREE